MLALLALVEQLGEARLPRRHVGELLLERLLLLLKGKARLPVERAERVVAAAEVLSSRGTTWRKGERWPRRDEAGRGRGVKAEVGRREGGGDVSSMDDGRERDGEGESERTCRMYLWYRQRDGRCDTVRSVMPSSVAAREEGQLGGEGLERERGDAPVACS